MGVTFQILAASSSSDSFVLYGVGALALVIFIMYIIFAKESSLGTALSDTVFRSSGFAFVISTILAFLFWYEMSPKMAGFHVLSFTHNESMIGLSIVLWLLLFGEWRVRIRRGRRKRKNKVKAGI